MAKFAYSGPPLKQLLSKQGRAQPKPRPAGANTQLGQSRLCEHHLRHLKAALGDLADAGLC
jgi:hypothetical protein